jgi:hypothetical protein
MSDMKLHIVLLAAASAIALAAGPAAAQEMRYRITDTIVGSILPQEIIRSSAPIEGRYSELTPAQKAAVASDYESLAAGDEPPYPMYGVRHLISPVVRYVDAGEPVGSLVATVVIDSQGKPGKITVYKSPDQVLTRFVASQLATEEYKPALCHGQPCEMTYVLRLEFPRRGNLHVSQSTSTYDPNSKSHDGH